MRKKFWLTGAILAGLLALGFGATSVFAHGNQVGTDGETVVQGDHCGTGGTTGGWGAMNGWGMMGGNYYGFMHTESLESIADILGLTVEQLEGYLEDGATLAELAEDAGVDVSVIADSILEAHGDMAQWGIDNGYHSEEDIQAMIEGMISGDYGAYGYHHDSDEDHDHGDHSGFGGHGGMMGGGGLGGGFMGGTW